MKKHFLIKNAVLSAGLALSFASTAAEVKTFDNMIELQSQKSGRVDVSIAGPNNFAFKSRYDAAPAITLNEIDAYEDGLYKYEFVEIDVLGQETVQDDFNGRGTATRNIVKSNVVSGHFRIKGGAIVSDQAVEEESSLRDTVIINNDNFTRKTTTKKQ